MSKAKQRGINPALEEAIDQLLKQVMADPTASLTDKVKILDRSIKLEALKLRQSDDDWGAAFFQEDDDK